MFAKSVSALVSQLAVPVALYSQISAATSWVQ